MSEIHHEKGDELLARDYLERGYVAAARQKSELVRFFCLLVDAQICLDLDDEPTGIELLRQAFTLASERGYVTKFFWRPKVMVRLCIKALEHDIAVSFVRSLIRTRGLLKESPSWPVSHWPWPIRVETFGRFVLFRDDEPVVSSGKVQRKPLELLKALVASGGREAHEGELADLLWPDVDGDMSRANLKTTLHRLRQLIGLDDAIAVRDGRLYIDRRFLHVDIWGFEYLLDEAGKKQEAGLEAEAESLTEKALAIHRGSFLAGDDAPWLFPSRERLAQRYSAAVRSMGKKLLERGDYRFAISCFRQGLEIYPASERLYQGLMESLLAAGDYGEAATAYKKCKKALAINLGVAPSAVTEKLYRHALAEG